jgi:uncharacterized RDD family membrane protein YckC
MDDWHQEVSARVDGYRRRQARLRGKDELTPSLDFDFEARQASGDPPNARILDFPSSGLTASPPPATEPDEDEEEASLGALGGESGGFGSLENPPAETAGEFFSEMLSEPRPLEIILEGPPSPAEPEASPAGVEGPLAVAPVGKRFLAGVLDALVLLAAGGLFELIFWRAGGQLSKTPLDLAVMGFIAGFFILLYFAAFTIFNAATPGLAALGLEVRAANGGPPNLRDSLWRGVGYLVSIAPLMLGFVWVLVDGDGLTWHDRMSGTFVAAAEPGRAPALPREL